MAEDFQVKHKKWQVSSTIGAKNEILPYTDSMRQGLYHYDSSIDNL